MHPGPSSGRGGGSYPGPRDIWGALPVENKKLESK